jgi:hypothetical protein
MCIIGRSRSIHESGNLLILGHQAEQLSEAVDCECVLASLSFEELSEERFLGGGGAGQGPHRAVAFVVEAVHEFEAVLISLLLVLFTLDYLTHTENPLESLWLE